MGTCGLPAALSRLLTAYTMLFWVENSGISREFRSKFANRGHRDSSDIALPTVLPRRNPHSMSASRIFLTSCRSEASM